MDQLLKKLNLPSELIAALKTAKKVIVPKSKVELRNLIFGGTNADTFEVYYEVPGRWPVKEADVVRCKNGAVVNYPEDYMRRRDPDSMRIGDDLDTDKPRFDEVYNHKFEDVRNQTFDWISRQDLIVMPFLAGGTQNGYPALAVIPGNAAFFAYGLAELQGFVSIDDIDSNFTPRAIVYVAPPFRHTHFDGKQVVVHNRTEDVHEVFSYNLYPGPSAKKGVYSVLLDIGENEGWVTAHASVVRITTPYENEVVIMHEGASGGGKSEMLEEIHRQEDKTVLIATHIMSGEQYFINMTETCTLEPVTDDMAMCHPKMQNNSGKLCVADAEEGWFLRMDHMTHYATDYQYEKICIHPDEPLLFLNMQGIPGATCLIWEHSIDSTGKPCPNPRAIVPRRMIKNIVNTSVEVDVRSFGVRMPPSTLENPNYGIMGMLHIIPPSLAWLWRLVSPRGHKNPSIVDAGGMMSEGVGSYWPFATGKKVTQANLLLKQIMDSPNTRHVLIPNQHIGAYKVGFAGEWIAREYLARHGGARIRKKHLAPARCPILGYSLTDLKIDGQLLRQTFLRPEFQSKLGFEGYDKGAAILTDFFKEQISQFLTDDLDPLGRQIIECCLNDGTLEDYLKLTPMDLKD